MEKGDDKKLTSGLKWSWVLNGGKEEGDSFKKRRKKPSEFYFLREKERRKHHPQQDRASVLLYVSKQTTDIDGVSQSREFEDFGAIDIGKP